MRKPGFLSQLQEQLKNLTQDELGRLDREGGLKIDDAIELILRPTSRGADIYVEVDLSDHILESNRDIGENLGVLLYVSEDVNLRRKDIEEFIDRCTAPIWVSYPPHRFEEVAEIFRSCVILPQFEFLALTPDNQVLEGENRLRPCGSGDALVSLISSDSYQNFLRSGGENIYYVDLQSKCFIDKQILNYHEETRSNVTVPVVEGKPGDRCSVLCEINRQPQLLEEFLFLSRPESFNHVHSGHMVFRTDLSLDMIRWNWTQRKSVRGNRIECEFKRYISDLTEAYDSQFVRVQRDVYFFSNA